jgi:hypothetical protein
MKKYIGNIAELKKVIGTKELDQNVKTVVNMSGMNGWENSKVDT